MAKIDILKFMDAFKMASDAVVQLEMMKLKTAVGRYAEGTAEAAKEMEDLEYDIRITNQILKSRKNDSTGI